MKIKTKALSYAACGGGIVQIEKGTESAGFAVIFPTILRFILAFLT